MDELEPELHQSKEAGALTQEVIKIRGWIHDSSNACLNRCQDLLTLMLVTHEGGRTVRANPEQRQVLGPPKWKKNTLEWYCRRIILYASSFQMIQLKYVLEILYFYSVLSLKMNSWISEYDLTEGPLEKYSDAQLFSWIKNKCRGKGTEPLMEPWGMPQEKQLPIVELQTEMPIGWKKNSDDWIGWWFSFTPRHSYILLGNMHLNPQVEGGHLLNWIM